MRITSRFHQILAAVFGSALIVFSGAAEAGIIRRAGSTTAVAPPAPGTMVLTADTIAIGDAIPTVPSDYVYHNGLGPGVSVDFAGSTACQYFVEECWGEYAPGESVFLEGAIWGGHNTAILSYDFEIRDSFGTVLFAFDETSPETTTGALFAPGDPGNPCNGVNHYDIYGSANCQLFSVSFDLPDTIPFNEWLTVHMSARYTAPAGQIFAISDANGDFVQILFSEIGLPAPDLLIKRVPTVPEAPTLGLLLVGGLGLWRRHRARTQQI